MVARIRHVTIDCTNPYALGEFWAAVTGWKVEPENEPGDSEVLVAPSFPEGDEIGLLFIQVPEYKKVKNRVHLDLGPTNHTRDDEVIRLTGLGGSVVSDMRTKEGLGWVVMADPEGNEFCVERSDAERAAVR